MKVNKVVRLKVGEIVKTELAQFGLLVFDPLLSGLSGPAFRHQGPPNAGGCCCICSSSIEIKLPIVLFE